MTGNCYFEGGALKVENGTGLICSNCGTGDPHGSPYLREHLGAGRCANCARTRVYPGHTCAE